MAMHHLSEMAAAVVMQSALVVDDDELEESLKLMLGRLLDVLRYHSQYNETIPRQTRNVEASLYRGLNEFHECGKIINDIWCEVNK